MASDEEYMDFLIKAGQDPSAGQPKAAAAPARATFKTQDSGAEIPAAIKEIVDKKDLFYVSEADEPFVAVALEWDDEEGNGLPSENEFARLIQHSDPTRANIEIQDPEDWDRRGRYHDVVDAVRRAVEGSDVRVYKVEGDGARVEYWLVGCEGEGKEARIVGVKALAVES